jgi:hypothetical protein
MGLLITRKQASDMGVTGQLIDLLLERGARLDLTRDDARFTDAACGRLARPPRLQHLASAIPGSRIGDSK